MSDSKPTSPKTEQVEGDGTRRFGRGRRGGCRRRECGNAFGRHLHRRSVYFRLGQFGSRPSDGAGPIALLPSDAVAPDGNDPAQRVAAVDLGRHHPPAGQGLERRSSLRFASFARLQRLFLVQKVRQPVI